MEPLFVDLLYYGCAINKDFLPNVLHNPSQWWNSGGLCLFRGCCVESGIGLCKGEGWDKRGYMGRTGGQEGW